MSKELLTSSTPPSNEPTPRNNVISLRDRLSRMTNQTPTTASEIEIPEGKYIDFEVAKKELERKEVSRLAKEFLLAPEETGSYKEAIDPTGYVAELLEIASMPQEKSSTALETLSWEDRELLLEIQRLRMAKTDALPKEIAAQMNHIKQVDQIAYSQAIDMTIEALEKQKNDDDSLSFPINIKLLRAAALLHDGSKNSAGYSLTSFGNLIPPQLVMSKIDPQKPMANADLIGHNAHSALESIAILTSIGLTEKEARVVAQWILLHSKNEFPQLFVETMPPGMTEPFVGADSQSGVDVTTVHMGKWGSPFGDVKFFNGPLPTLEAQILNGADLIDGADVQSYFKYLLAHVMSPALIKKDRSMAKNSPDLPDLHMYQVAIQSCLNTSFTNYLHTPIESMRNKYGVERIATAQAYQEFLDIVNVDGASPIKKALDTTNKLTGESTDTQADKELAIAAYQSFLSSAEEYAREKKKTLGASFNQTYALTFLERQLVQLEADYSFWNNRYQGGNERERQYHLRQYETLRPMVDAEISRLKKIT